MIHLSPEDSSILTRVGQYNRIPLNQRLELLSKASDQAQQVGRILLDVEPAATPDPDVLAVAQAFKRWVASNRRPRPTRHSSRRLASAQ